MNGLRERPDFATRMHTLHDLPLASRASYLKRRKWQLHSLLPEVIYRGTSLMLLSLLARGADPNTADEGGVTPLLYATDHRRAAMVSLLLRFGVDPNRPDHDGYTPLMHHGPTLITRRLLYSGADPHARTWGPWSYQTPLHATAGMGTCGSVRMLLQWGAEVDARDGDADTPLMAAVTGHGSPFTRLLLEHGAALHTRNSDGDTPLLLAVGRGFPEMVRFLVQQGANLQDRDAKGRDVFQCAEEGYWRPEETVAVLRHALHTG